MWSQNRPGAPPQGRSLLQHPQVGASVAEAADIEQRQGDVASEPMMARL